MGIGIGGGIGGGVDLGLGGPPLISVNTNMSYNSIVSSPDTTIQSIVDGIVGGSGETPGGDSVISSSLVINSCSGITIDLHALRLWPWTFDQPNSYMLRTESGSSYSQSTLAAGGLAAVASITASGSKGATTLALSGGGTVTPGYYLINTDLAVVHNTSGVSQYGGRQLIKITSVVGSTATLDSLSALGRDYVGATLHDVTSVVIDNCTIHLPTVRALYGELQYDSMRRGTAVFLGYLYNCDVYHAHQTGAKDSGVKFAYCTACRVHNPSSSNMSGSSTRYGLEFYGCCHMVTSGSRGINCRTYSLSQGGCADMVYTGGVHEQLKSETATRGRVDGGHGFAEEDLQIIDTICNNITIGNPSWRKGAYGVTVSGCDVVNLQLDCRGSGSISDSVIGTIICNTEVQVSDSEGTLGAGEFEFDNCTISPTDSDKCISTTGTTTIYSPESMTFRDCIFNQSDAAALILSMQIDNPVAGPIVFEDCEFHSSGSANFLSIYGGGEVDVTLTRCQFHESTGKVVALNGTVNAQVSHEGCVRVSGKTETPLVSGDFFAAGTVTATIEQL